MFIKAIVFSMLFTGLLYSQGEANLFSTLESSRTPVNQVFQYKVELTETGWKKGKDKQTVTYLWIFIFSLLRKHLPQRSQKWKGVTWHLSWIIKL